MKTCGAGRSRKQSSSRRSDGELLTKFNELQDVRRQLQIARCGRVIDDFRSGQDGALADPAHQVITSERTR